jgi:pimeloyl-ACP methyl ester carboxylesterase
MAIELDWKERGLHDDAPRMRCFEAGNGAPIIVFPSEDGGLTNPILGKLAESYRIICLDLTSRADSNANQLTQITQKLPNALTRLGIERSSLVAIAAGSRSALALAIAAPERIDRLILISPQLPTDSAELPELSAVKAATLVLIGTSNSPAATEAGRLCREKIPSCHLSFVYGDELARNLGAWLAPIIQFLEEGEQFIIFRQSQLIRPDN